MKMSLADRYGPPYLGSKLNTKNKVIRQLANFLEGMMVNDSQTANENSQTDDSGRVQKVFEALASSNRRKILAYLAHASLTAGEIAERFSMTKPSISQHLSVLEAAGLVTKEKRGQFVHYSLVQDNLVNSLNGFVQNVCPVSRPLKQESAAISQNDKK